MTDGRERTAPGTLYQPRQFRCGVCGHLLLGLDECREHPGSYRVLWTQELSQAYREIVDAIAAGMSLDRLAGRSETHRAAAEYAGAWRRRRAS